MRTSRRGFIARLLIGLGALSLPAGRIFVPPKKVTATGQFPTARWVQSSADEFGSGAYDGVELDAAQGGLVLVSGRNDGWYTSRVAQIGLTFNAIGSLLDVDMPSMAGVDVVVRTSRDGISWSDWHVVPPMSDMAREMDQVVGDLRLEVGAFVQYRLRLYRSVASAQSPRVWRVTWICIDSSAGPTAQDLALPRDPAARASGVGPPGICPRSAWGCPEPFSSVNWPPEYRTVVKFVVHHTATSNDQDPPTTMRAIWQYHAVELGWGDFGYNFCVDRFGNIYEGRFGGEGVVGGHARCYNYGSVGAGLLGTFSYQDVTPAMQDGLVQLAAWKCFRHGIHPQWTGFFIDRNFYNICGHRDLNSSSTDGCQMSTECPGDYLYNRLSEIRGQTSDAMRWGEWWISDTTPASMAPGQRYTVRVTVQNRGTRTWARGGSNPVHLGYHWYRQDGSQYSQSTQDDIRTSLPQDVTFGQTIGLDAGVVAPRDAGQYRLEWDLVEEYVTWFSNQGNVVLSKNVSVASVGPQYGAQWIGHNTPSTMGPGQPASVTVTVRNTSSFTWPKDGANPVHLGWRWYRANGSLYTGTPERGGLPNDVAPNQTVTVNATVTPPLEPGTYTLKYDLVWEGNAWFSDKGVGMLSATVNVPPPVLSVSPAALFFLADGQTAPRPQSVRIGNTGSGLLSWQAASNKGWCTVSAPAGTAPSTLFINVDRGAFFPGSSDTATVEIRATSPGAQQSPQYVQVIMVYPPSPLQRSDVPVIVR